mgnify:CR=1 FL=1
MIKNKLSKIKKDTGYKDGHTSKSWRQTENSCPWGRKCDVCGTVARKMKEEKTLKEAARELREILNNEL